LYKIVFTFAKKGKMKYISHLDLMRTLTRAMRRAELPLKMTEGFSPHPKLSMASALKLGLESESEEASILLKEPIEAGEFREKLNKQLPQGIEVRTARGVFK
jgi:radical SAM-linked protein